jgi:hypothetical protein
MTDCWCEVTVCVVRYASPYRRNTSANVGEAVGGEEVRGGSARYGPVGGVDVDISMLLVIDKDAFTMNTTSLLTTMDMPT